MHGYRLACVAAIPMECSESKESVAACGGDHYRTRVGQPALMRKTKARSILQQFDLFAPDLHSALGLRVLQCRFGSRARTRGAHAAAARLRDVFDAFRGFSNIHTDSSCNASRFVPSHFCILDSCAPHTHCFSRASTLSTVIALAPCSVAPGRRSLRSLWDSRLLAPLVLPGCYESPEERHG